MLIPMPSLNHFLIFKLTFFSLIRMALQHLHSHIYAKEHEQMEEHIHS